MDKYAMAFVVIVTTMASSVFVEFIKWFDIIFGAKQNTVKGVLLSLFTGTIGGVFMAVIGVNLIKRGRFENMTKDLGEQVDSYIIVLIMLFFIVKTVSLRGGGSQIHEQKKLKIF